MEEHPRREAVAAYLARSREAISALATPERLELFDRMAAFLCRTLAAGNKILFAGNGGSAADCQHIAGEMVGRFRRDRAGMAGIALTVDTSVLTATLNDFGADRVFARQIEALGRKGDVLWAISTSGNSPNILAACEQARQSGMGIMGFTGGDGGRLAAMCDLAFIAPAAATSHIQECHITVGHMLCLEMEERLYGEK